MFGKEQRMLIYTGVGPVKSNKVHSSVLAYWVIILNLYAKMIFFWNLEVMMEILSSSLNSKYKWWGG